MKNITLFTGYCALIFSVFTANSQIITTVAGNGTSGYSGNGVAATSAELAGPNNVVFDKSGNYYIADEENDVIRKVNTAGIITTIAGTGGIHGYSGNGGLATAAELYWPRMITLDSAGNIYFSDYKNGCVRKIDSATGIITNFAGTGVNGYNGDGVAATSAELNGPNGIGFDKHGNLYIADANNERIREVNGLTGIITTIAGTGTSSFSGDGGQATAAELDYPYGLAVDDTGNVYFTDMSNYCVRKITMNTGIINTIAGIGSVTGFSGDGGPATAAELSTSPSGVTFDVSGNFYIADAGNACIRKVNKSGIITTIAGMGTVTGYSGDGGLATAAELHIPDQVAFDTHGNMYIPDWGNNVVREVTNVDNTNGINEVENNSNISVFPNPTNECLYIALNGITGKVILTLYTIEGQEMINQSFSNQPTLNLNISALSNGLYILRIQKEDGTSIVRKVEIEK